MKRTGWGNYQEGAEGAEEEEEDGIGPSGKPGTMPSADDLMSILQS